MALLHQPLTEAELGPAVWKVVRPEAPAPLKGMVAKGLAPLPPRDLLVALYQFWAAADPELGEQSAKTVVGLPPNIVTGALDDKNLPSGVLDFLGRKLPRNETVLERVVRHPKVDDETLAGIARLCPESICDIIADNQQRWLGFPAIVEALYQNPHCRMSVAQRMLELAVREGLELSLPNIEELKQAIAGRDTDEDDEQDDAQDVEAGADLNDDVFRQAAQRVMDAQRQLVDRAQQVGPDEELDLNAPLAADDTPLVADDDAEDGEPAPEDPEAPKEAEEAEKPSTKPRGFVEISQLKVVEKLRMAVLGTAFERSILIRDSNKSVCMSAIKSPKIKENEVVTYCANRSLSHDVIRYISKRREWTKLYAVKLGLVLNPKTPMSAAMGFLAHLHAHDIRKVARSKNIPAALATAAKRRLSQRR